MYKIYRNWGDKATFNGQYAESIEQFMDRYLPDARRHYSANVRASGAVEIVQDYGKPYITTILVPDNGPHFSQWGAIRKAHEFKVAQLSLSRRLSMPTTLPVIAPRPSLPLLPKLAKL